MSDLDLSKAYATGASKLEAFLGGGPLTIQHTNRFANGAASFILDAALPDVLDALADEVDQSIPGTHSCDYEDCDICDAHAVRYWLRQRAKAARLREARNG